MHPHLQDLLTRSQRASRTVHEIWNDATDEQKTWRPAADSWSIAECLEHLVITARAYEPVMEAGIGRARQSGKPADTPVKFTWFGGFFVRSVGPQPKHKLKSPGLFQIASHSPRIDVMGPFDQAQGRIEEWIRRSEGGPLNGPKLTSPVTRFIRLTVGEALSVLVGHTERHVAQAHRVTENATFPKKEL